MSARFPELVAVGSREGSVSKDFASRSMSGQSLKVCVVLCVEMIRAPLHNTTKNVRRLIFFIFASGVCL